MLLKLLRPLRSSSGCSGAGAYGFHEGLEKVEKPGSTELIVEMVLKLLAKEETLRKLLKGVIVEFGSDCVGKFGAEGGGGRSSLFTTSVVPSPLTPTKLKLMVRKPARNPKGAVLSFTTHNHKGPSSPY